MRMHSYHYDGDDCMHVKRLSPIMALAKYIGGGVYAD